MSESTTDPTETPKQQAERYGLRTEGRSDDDLRRAIALYEEKDRIFCAWWNAGGR